MHPVFRFTIPLILPLILVITAVASAAPRQEDSRFERIVEQITDGTIRSEAVQEIGFSFSHNRFSGTLPQETQDTAAVSDSSIVGFTPELLWISRTRKASASRALNRTVTAHLSGTLQRHGILHGDDVVSITTASNFNVQQTALNLDFNQELTRRAHTKVPVHFSMSDAIFAHGIWQVKSGFEPDMPDAFLEKNNIPAIDETRQSFILGGETAFSLSIGSIRDLSVVMRALELEKRFLSIGGCAFPLSDKTLGALALHCATGRNSNLRRDSSLAAFKKVIDSLMITDAAVKKTDLRYVPPLDIRKTIMRQLPTLTQGLMASLSTHAKGALVVQRTVREWRYDPQKTQPALHLVKPMPAYNLDISLEGAATRALTPGVWVRLSSKGALLETKTYQNDTFFTQEKQQTHPWDFTGTGSILLCPSPVLQCEISIAQVPLFIAIPKDLPQHYGLTLWLGFEDRLGAQIGVSWTAPQKKQPVLETPNPAGLFFQLALTRVF